MRNSFESFEKYLPLYQTEKVGPEIENEPYHPGRNYKFPVRIESSGKKRSSHSKWFEDYPWLHYSEALDKVFCFHCVKAYQEQKITNSKIEMAFIETGFKTWSKPKKKKFSFHEFFGGLFLKKYFKKYIFPPLFYNNMKNKVVVVALCFKYNCKDIMMVLIFFCF